MAMNFPSSPTVGQIYTSGGASFIWDGTKWKSLGVNVLARDQNLADLANVVTARQNLGLIWHPIGKWDLPSGGIVFNVTGYKKIRFSCNCLFPAIGYIGMRVSFDNAATYITSASYMQATIYNNGGTLVATAQTAQTIFTASATQESSAVQASADGTVSWTPTGFVHFMSHATGATNALGMTNAMQTAFLNHASKIPTHIAIIPGNTTFSAGTLTVEGIF